MPSFSSHFNIAHPKGAEWAIQEKATIKERKHHRREGAMKHMECQKHGASLSDDDDDDDEEGSKEEDEYLVSL